MIKSKTRSTACKMACACLLTVFVLNNTVQKTLFIPVFASDPPYYDGDSPFEVWFNSIYSPLQESTNDVYNFVSSLNYDDLVIPLPSSVTDVLIAYSLTNSFIMQAQWAYDAQVEMNLNELYTYTGLYRSSGSNALHTCHLYGYIINGQTIAVSDEFSLSVDFYTTYISPSPTILFSCNSNNGYFNSFSSNDSDLPSASYTIAISDRNGFLNNYSRTNLGKAGLNCHTRYDVNSIPVVDGLTDSYNYILSTSFLCGAVPVPVFPSGAFESAEPWKYYNDSLYPYISENFPAGLEYVPEPIQDIPDMSGLTFPPDLPSVSFNAPEMPLQSLPENMLSGAGFWFTQFNNLLDGLGIKYIVIIIMIAVLLLSILRF